MTNIVTFSILNMISVVFIVADESIWFSRSSSKSFMGLTVTNKIKSICQGLFGLFQNKSCLETKLCSSLIHWFKGKRCFITRILIWILYSSVIMKYLSVITFYILSRRTIFTLDFVDFGDKLLKKKKHRLYFIHKTIIVREDVYFFHLWMLLRQTEIIVES